METETTGRADSSRSVLGRGIGSLLPETNKRGYFMCPIGELYPNHAQPRKHFDEPALEELAQSIREKGVLQPILAKKTDKGYVIIAGERRWRASQKAGKKEVPVILKDLSDNEILETALIENVQREDLNPIEESESYQRLILDLGLTQEEVSKRVGKDRTTIANALRLLKLSKEVREKIATGELSVGHARALITIEDKAVQNKLLEEIISKGYSVRQVEALAKRFKGNDAAGNTETTTAAANEELTAWKTVGEDLQKYFDAKVEIRPHVSGRGQIIINFLSRDDFDRILGKMTNSK
ncbi:MAG: ParB/RepB/Spo0J family partition protein [Deltaproteobacteria bacterium]|nr:ParB/RepB/Spo0J family partition protein [Deltaproteobacteria bacterium]